jgi:hypothetical protein
VPLRPDHSAGDNVENKVETRRIEVAPVYLLQAGNRRKIVVPSVLWVIYNHKLRKWDAIDFAVRTDCGSRVKQFRVYEQAVKQ